MLCVTEVGLVRDGDFPAAAPTQRKDAGGHRCEFALVSLGIFTE